MHLSAIENVARMFPCVRRWKGRTERGRDILIVLNSLSNQVVAVHPLGCATWGVVSTMTLLEGHTQA